MEVKKSRKGAKERKEKKKWIEGRGKDGDEKKVCRRVIVLGCKKR